MNKKLFTYKKSGVDITAADKFVKFISNITAKKRGKKKFSNIGGFGSINNIPKNIKNPKIVACTDGVGTKVEIANILDKYDTIGIDLVAMSVNDLIVQGAKPLFFLDYISINKIDLKKLKSILKGIIKGCKISTVNWWEAKLPKCLVLMKRVNLILLVLLLDCRSKKNS
jgi:phosphoribosylaminoimidazole synthetase